MEVRPKARRHCAGRCFSENQDAKGWTKVVDTKVQSLFIDEEIEQQPYVANATSKAEFLEVSPHHQLFLNCHVFMLMILALIFNHC